MELDLPVTALGIDEHGGIEVEAGARHLEDGRDNVDAKLASLLLDARFA